MFSSRLDAKHARLAALPALRDAQFEQLRFAGRVLDLATVPAGTTLLRQGDYGRDFFLIVDGRASASRDGVVIGELGPGDVVGELALQAGSDHQRTATVVAMTEMVLATGTVRELDGLLDQVPALRIQVERSVQERRHVLSQR